MFCSYFPPFYKRKQQQNSICIPTLSEMTAIAFTLQITHTPAHLWAKSRRIPLLAVTHVSLQLRVPASQWLSTALEFLVMLGNNRFPWQQDYYITSLQLLPSSWCLAKLCGSPAVTSHRHNAVRAKALTLTSLNYKNITKCFNCKGAADGIHFVGTTAAEMLKSLTFFCPFMPMESHFKSLNHSSTEQMVAATSQIWPSILTLKSHFNYRLILSKSFPVV